MTDVLLTKIGDSTPKPTKIIYSVTICSGETYKWAVEWNLLIVGGTYLVTNDGCTTNQMVLCNSKPTKVSTQ
jgi:hypothetical protein